MKGDRPTVIARGLRHRISHWNKTEGRQAVPPAYTEYIGTQLLDALERAA